MLSFLKNIKERFQGKIPRGSKRSGKWPRVRMHFLENYPRCEACGGNRNVEVHHVKPFHENPELELDVSNLITLCESRSNGANCHLLFGHLGNFRSINPDAVADAEMWLNKIRSRE
jgi:hypothetical protein